MGKPLSPPHSPVQQVDAAVALTSLPAVPGVYALRLVLQNPCQVALGRRSIALPAGCYLYVGSARGPGGLRARLGRHLSGAGRPHWHIDALRGRAQVVGAYYCAASVPLECRWAHALLALPGVTAPAPGFGASDCRAGCPAHLLLCHALADDIRLTLEAAALSGGA